MAKISTYFSIQEFVPKEVYARFADKSIWFVDKRLILAADFIRGRFGKAMTINNWHSGGTFNYRGFRQRGCEVGGEFSQHRFGRGVDFNIDGITPQEVYKDILSNAGMYIKAGITTVEDIAYTSGWTHCDIRPQESNSIVIVKP